MGIQTLAKRERLEQIRVMLDRNGSGSIEELVDLLKVSRMTVHRDLHELDALGVLRKVRGGATIERSTLYESDYHARLRVNRLEKIAIARAAIKLIDPGMAVMVDSSTTVNVLAMMLPALRPLTVISNSLSILNELAKADGIRLIGLGGDFIPHYWSFTGIAAESAARQLRADIGFFSLASIDGLAVCHPSGEAVRINRALKDGSRKSVLLADSSKFGRTTLNVFGSVTEFDVVIVDSGVDAAQLDIMRDAGVKVIVSAVVTEEQGIGPAV